MSLLWSMGAGEDSIRFFLNQTLCIGLSLILRITWVRKILLSLKYLRWFTGYNISRNRKGVRRIRLSNPF